MDWPGSMLPIQAKSGDEKFAWKFRSLKEQSRAFFREDQRHRLVGFQPRVFRDFDIHQVSIVGRKKRMEDRMIGKNELESFAGALLCANRPFGLETELAQKAIDARRHAIDKQNDAAAISQVAPEQFAGVPGLQVVAFDAEHVGILVGGQFGGKLSWLQNARGPLTAHDFRRKRQTQIM